MEEESFREENRKAHEEDERFRMTAVKAAGQVRQRMRCATGESDEVIRRKFMLPERYILTLMTVETLGQERMLLDLMAGGRLGADLVLCGRRSFYADMLLRTARDRRLARLLGKSAIGGAIVGHAKYKGGVELGGRIEIRRRGHGRSQQTGNGISTKKRGVRERTPRI